MKSQTPIYLFLSVCILFFSNLLLNAQVVINEYSCSNISTIQDNYSEYEDWIELYNTGAAPVNLGGYYLSDKATNPTKWQFPSVTINGNGYLLIFASKRDELVAGNLHTNFKLSQTKPEFIVFSNPSAVLIEQVELIPALTDHSRGKTTDGAATWSVFTNPTPNTSNTNPKQEYCDKPVCSVNQGFYTGAQSVIITCSEPTATIRYTLDGSEPTTSSTIYSLPVNISTIKVLRVRAFSSNPDIPPSFIESNTYFINVNHTIAVVSIFGDEIETLMNGSAIEPEVGIEYFDKNLQYKAEATGEANKHGQDSWSFDQRGIDYITRDQFGYNYGLLDEMFTYSDRDDFQRIILKAAAGDGYPVAIGMNPPEYGPAHIRDAYVHTLSQRYNFHLDERTSEPCVMYVNGQYWGVYEIREKVDDADFTDYYYNQDEFDLQFIKYWGGIWAEYGGNQALTDWNNLKNFIETNDMTIQTNYDYADSLLNVKSLADYFLLNSYVVCKDWLNWNTSWWRGLNPNGNHKKWGYILWDEDATFGAYVNYTGIPDISPNADPCFPEQLSLPSYPEGQDHIDILNKLLENPGFHQYYISRYADLLNTAFKCENMQSLLDSLIALIQPEMPAQIARWGGSMAEWQTNVQNLKDFIDARCDTIADGMIDCYDLTGPYDITIMVEPPLSGTIELNSLNLYSFPWTGSYFGNIDILLDADPEPGFIFDYWELSNNTVSPDDTSEHVTLNLISGDTIIAHFTTGINVDLGNDTIICQGDFLILDAGNPGATYLWQDGSTNQTFTVTTAGTYFVSVNDGINTANDTIIISISSAEAGLDTTICNGENTTLYASGGLTYLWSPSDGLSDTTVYNPTANPLETTTYIVTVADISGCIYTDSVTVFVVSPVNISIYSDIDSICGGEPVTIYGDISGGNGGPYTVLMNDGTQGELPLVVYPDITGLIIASVYDACELDNVSDSVFITVLPQPPVNFTSDVVEGCEPLTVKFNESSPESGQSYLWDFGGDFSYSKNPEHTFENDGTFDITLTVTSKFGCINTFTYENMLTVYPLPEASFTPAQDTAIILKPIIYFDNYSINASHYYWDFDDGSTSIAKNPMHTYLNTGTYYVRLIAESNFTCRDTAYSYVHIKEHYTFYIPSAFSPNNDEINDIFITSGTGIEPGNFSMLIYNRFGEKIFETDDINLGWDGKDMNNVLCKNEVYTWIIIYKDLFGGTHKESGSVTLIR